MEKSLFEGITTFKGISICDILMTAKKHGIDESQIKSIYRNKIIRDTYAVIENKSNNGFAQLFSATVFVCAVDADQVHSWDLIFNIP